MKEKDVFTQHYCTIKDVCSLLPHFVTAKIIGEDDRKEINTLRTSSEKVQKLLTHISGPLDAGNTQPFYLMLSIMEEHGTEATKKQATVIRRKLISSGNTHIQSHEVLGLWCAHHTVQWRI